MTLTRYGFREWGLALLVAVALWTVLIFLIRSDVAVSMNWLWYSLLGITLVFFLAFAAFFRNPARQLPANPAELASPADGVVKDIEIIDFDQAPFQGKALRIGIFLSVFDVHVNRVPAEIKIISKVYREGRYLDARNPDCARENEAMTIAGEAKIGEKSFPLAIRQVSGAIARRIVCPVEPGEELKRGQIYGMIKFGSRTELYLPAEGFKVTVQVGDKVYGGQSVVAIAE